MAERARAAALACVALVLGACAAAPGLTVGRPAPGAARADELLVPAGNGSLLQDEITLTLASDSVVLKVTPLEEWVLRLTAPDTWSRLSSLAAAQRSEVSRQTGEEGAALFLVSFFSRTPGAAFHPQDVQLENRGRRQRPLLIRPLTVGWGSERLQPEVTQSAVYAFPAEVDLEQSLVVDYGVDLGTGWDEILRRLEAERGRARARAGLGR